jgi:hypothetical protein
MKTNILYLFLFSTLNIFWSACGNTTPANSQTLFVEHYVRYDEEDKSIKAIATFKIGDSLQNAKATAIKDGVVLNGAALKETNSDAGINYNIEGPKVKFDPAYRFSFKNPLTQKLYETELLLASATNIVVKDGVLSKKDGGTITWQGGGLANSEELSMRIEDSKGNNSEINVVGNGNNPAQYDFRGGQLDDVAPGAATIYIVRTKNQPIGQPNVPVKGTLQTQYFAMPIKVMVQ